MSEEQVRCLIEELRGLSIRRQQIADREREIFETLDTLVASAAPDPVGSFGGSEGETVGSAESLQPENTPNTQQRREATTSSHRPVSSNREQSTRARSPVPGSYSVGDHVFIQNRIRHVPASRRENSSNRAAVVTRITQQRVYYTTYNGFNGWRDPSNIRHLTVRDQANYHSNMQATRVASSSDAVKGGENKNGGGASGPGQGDGHGGGNQDDSRRCNKKNKHHRGSGDTIPTI